jgi:hypothetical protein
MSHPFIASLSTACLVGALPLAAQAADDIALPAPNPLQSSATLAPHDFSMLRVKAPGTRSAEKMAPVIYGPDFVPKWQMRAVSHHPGASKLQGERFRFR